MITTLPITICFTYFKSLALANLDAALFSVRQQEFTQVESIVIVDNDSEDSVQEIQRVIDAQAFPVPVNFFSYKHGDATLTHSWSTNQAVRRAVTPWVLFCRADYLLDFDIVTRFAAVATAHFDDWDGFITGNVYHLDADVGVCEQSAWRRYGPAALRPLPGAEADYTCIDAGVWMLRRRAFEEVSGLNERLIGWGHAQTHFQHKLHRAGVECVRIPELLFYHPKHSAPRDIGVAHAELLNEGINIHELWERHAGVKPY